MKNNIKNNITENGNVNYEEDLIFFYNKYLNLGIGEGYLYDLMDRYMNCWKKKEQGMNPTNGSISIQDIPKYRLNEEDYRNFSRVDQEFINFYHTTTIEVNEDYDVVIDAYGNITKFIFKKELSSVERQELSAYINKNIFNLLHELPQRIELENAISAAENTLLQNILASKINKAVFEKIRKEENDLSAAIFGVANSKVFSYDDSLKQNLDYEELFGKKLSHSRSLR